MAGQVSGLDGLLGGLMAVSWLIGCGLGGLWQQEKGRAERAQGQAEVLSGLLVTALSNNGDVTEVVKNFNATYEKLMLGIPSSNTVSNLPDPLDLTNQDNNFQLDDSQPWLPFHELQDRSMLSKEEAELFKVPDDLSGSGGWVGPE